MKWFLIIPGVILIYSIIMSFCKGMDSGLSYFIVPLYHVISIFIAIFFAYYLTQERNKAILIRLNENEKKCLLQKSEECGLKMEPFVRRLIMDCEIKAKRSNEYVKLIREINAIGNNINQIAHVANSCGQISYASINRIKDNQEQIMQLVRGLR